MKVIKVKAKVLEQDEDQMEINEAYDLGTIANSKKWVWRSLGLQVQDIDRIVEFNETKSIVLTVWDEKILVKEPFDGLFARWQEAKLDEYPQDVVPGDSVEQEEEE